MAAVTAWDGGSPKRVKPAPETRKHIPVVIAFMMVTMASGGARGLSGDWIQMALAGMLPFRRLREALSRIVNYRDSYTDNHCARVMELVGELGRKCGLTANASRVVEVAARFHDIGKVGIPDAILLKPDRLTEEEFDRVKEHSLIGADIIREIDSPGAGDLTPLVLHHHERFDGAGYPLGLSGEEIPLGARIIAVADSFDAMTTPRSYRAAMPTATALEEIRRQSGAQFDPRVAEALIRMLG